MKVAKEDNGDSPAAKAQAAMLNRNKKSTDQMTQYYYVIGFFIAVCVAAVIFTFANPKK
jgi:hypothetical protein